MNFPRSSGILLHPTSLPGPFGIGDLGPQAYVFADFLVASGQSLWQVLPLGPTGYGDSPYACYSAFAGNTLLISPEKLVEDKLLVPADLKTVTTDEGERINFETVHKSKDSLLHIAFLRFQQNTNSALRNDFDEFVRRNVSWLDDYAIFRALKDAHGGVALVRVKRLVGVTPGRLGVAAGGLRCAPPPARMKGEGRCARPPRGATGGGGGSWSREH